MMPFTVALTLAPCSLARSLSIDQIGTEWVSLDASEPRYENDRRLEWETT
jgi:hypothetical protein